MQTSLRSFMRSPGGENENSSNPNEDEKIINKESASNEPKKEKGFFGKIKEALQDWSNTDQKEQDFDDTQP